MELLLARNEFTKLSTIGDLYIGKAKECFILEDALPEPIIDGTEILQSEIFWTKDLANKYPEAKVKGKTCIPYGRYKMIINWSTRFKRLMPLLLEVPLYEGIRIHSGNTAEDTDGCMITGTFKHQDKVTESKMAFMVLFSKLQSIIPKEEVFITIIKEGI